MTESFRLRNAIKRLFYELSGIHGSRDLRGNVSLLLDSVLLLALREVDDELVGDVALDLHRFHSLQEKDLPRNLIASIHVFQVVTKSFNLSHSDSECSLYIIVVNFKTKIVMQLAHDISI